MLYEFRMGDQLDHLHAVGPCADAADPKVLVFRPIHDGLFVFVRLNGVDIQESPRPLFQVVAQVRMVLEELTQIRVVNEEIMVVHQVRIVPQLSSRLSV